MQGALVAALLPALLSLGPTRLTFSAPYRLDATDPLRWSPRPADDARATGAGDPSAVGLESTVTLPSGVTVSVGVIANASEHFPEWHHADVPASVVAKRNGVRVAMVADARHFPFSGEG